jgi:hypothetical protein
MSTTASRRPTRPTSKFFSSVGKKRNRQCQFLDADSTNVDISRLTPAQERKYVLQKAWHRATGQNVRIVTKSEIKALRERVSNYKLALK